jgi:NagD protein
MNQKLFVIIGTLNKINDYDIEEVVKWIRCGAKIITTCPDVSDPGSKGKNSIIMPNNILHIIKKIIPFNNYCVGKPNPLMLRQALKLLFYEDLINYNLLFIGDSLDTDIKMAFEMGIDSALVMTGNTRMYMLQNSIIQPNYIYHSVQEICKDIE